MKCRVRSLSYLTLTVAFLLPRAHASVSPADLDALEQLFRGEGHFAKDPATAFEKSWKVFQEPRKKGDLEGMMGRCSARGHAKSRDTNGALSKRVYAKSNSVYNATVAEVHVCRI